MTPSTLAPPEPRQSTAPDVPQLRLRAPLSRVRRHEAPLLGRRAMLGSLAVHAALALAVWLVPVDRVRSLVRQPAAPGEDVAYLDLDDFPGQGGGAPAAGPLADPAIVGGEAAPALPAAPPVARGPAAAPVRPRTDGAVRFPTQVPRGIPGTPGGLPGLPGAAGPGGVPGGQAGGAGQGSGTGTVGAGSGRMRPGYRDPRLYPPRELPPERPPSDIERYRSRLQARLDVYNDSVAEESAHQRRLRNWTFKGKDGKEWGIAEGGQPVVAGRRIPLPVGIAPPIPRSSERDEEARERARELGQIDRQQQDQDRDRYTRERARAARERQDSIRRARQQQ